MKLDPNSVLAYAGFAHVWGGTHESRSQDPEYVENGLEANAKAGQLAPDLAGVLSARARIMYAQHRYEDAIQLALRAVVEQPECEGAQDMLGRAYFASGRYEEAARLAESAMEIISNDYNAMIPLINSFERLGRTADAERLRRREVQVLQDQLQHYPDDVRARVLLVAYLVAAGDKDGSVMQVKIAVAMPPADANILYNAACAYGLLGMKAEAMDSFRGAVAAGYSNTDWSTHVADLKILHDDPEFKEMTAPGARKAT